jgi:hypothetical protein
MSDGPRSQCQELYRLAKSTIPGGTQLLSKRPEMFAPDQWPAYYREAKGCEVVDLDGRRYVDMFTPGRRTSAMPAAAAISATRGSPRFNLTHPAGLPARSLANTRLRRIWAMMILSRQGSLFFVG